MIVYKIDVMAALKSAGYTSYRLRQEKLFGERMLQKLRNGQMVSWTVLGQICDILGCQPGDLIKNVPD